MGALTPGGFTGTPTVRPGVEPVPEGKGWGFSRRRSCLRTHGRADTGAGSRTLPLRPCPLRAPALAHPCGAYYTCVVARWTVLAQAPRAMAREGKTPEEREAEAALRRAENEAVASVLRRLRAGTDLDQHEAAHRANLHRAQYGHYEQGRNAVSFVTMLYIADGLGVSIEDIADAVRAELPKRPRRDRG